jgi:hypothetical protein
MTLEEIKSEIRVLPASDKIKLHKWLDYEMAPDFRSSDFCSRIGVDRSLEIRQAIEQKSEIPVPRSPKSGCESPPLARVRKAASSISHWSRR